MMRLFRVSAVALAACVTMDGCGGGGDSDGVISVSSDELSFHADLYGSRPSSQSIRIKANTSQVELPTIFYDTNYISSITTSYLNGSIIRALVTVVSPQSLGAGRYTTNLDIVSSQYQKNVNITYSISDSTAGLFSETRVDTISPYIAVSEKSSEFILRGKGFSNFSDADPALITVGNYEVASYSYINDTEIRVTLPSMEAGTHDVKIYHSSAEYSSNSSLEIVDPFVFSDSVITTDRASNLIYDDKRKAIIIINPTTSSIERYSYIDGEVWFKESLFIPDILTAEIGPDGDTLIVLRRRRVTKIDLNDPELAVDATSDFPEDILTYATRLSSCNSGLMIIGPNSGSELIVFNIFTGKIYKELNLEGEYYFGPKLFSQNSGNQVAIKEATGKFHILDCNGYEVTQMHNDYSLNHASVFASPDHSLFLIGGKDIYSSAFKYLNSLPDSYSVAAFSPDSSILYVFSGPADTITSYDLTDINAPKIIGELSVEVSNFIAYDLALSEDGNTLFFLSYDKIYVIDLTSSVLMGYQQPEQ
ncbi:MAG: IPT/TIG domain-containing protein [Candidatus Thiodiazotropha lotti]|nr:IPT/TIG domain-containing protein [Candidatus Thiodiazotropha lotti]